MIITKGMTNISGYIEYRYDYKYSMFSDVTEDDRECMFESDTFNSLSELLIKMSPEVLNEIAQEFDADKVWISCISFKGKSKNGDTYTDISMFEGSQRGHVATKINNEDITDRAMLNMKKIKDIVDNTLDQHPIKY